MVRLASHGSCAYCCGSLLTLGCGSVMFSFVMASGVGVEHKDRVWVWPWFGRPLALILGLLGEGPGRTMRGCFRVSSLGTDVPGVYGAQNGPVARCVSVADTSLSLSLSLSLFR
jgi:hypothetical protein